MGDNDIYEADFSFVDDDFYNLFNGKENIIGTNNKYLEKKINEYNVDPIKNKDKIAECYSELGKTPNGKKKPMVCWRFVKNGCCNHLSTNNNNIGKIYSNLWHPGIDEREYLKSKIH